MKALGGTQSKSLGGGVGINDDVGILLFILLSCSLYIPIVHHLWSVPIQSVTGTGRILGAGANPVVTLVLAWKHFRVIGSGFSGYGLRMSVIGVKAGAAGAGAGAVRSRHLWMNQ